MTLNLYPLLRYSIITSSSHGSDINGMKLWWKVVTAIRLMLSCPAAVACLTQWPFIHYFSHINDFSSLSFWFWCSRKLFLHRVPACTLHILWDKQATHLTAKTSTKNFFLDEFIESWFWVSGERRKNVIWKAAMASGKAHRRNIHKVSSHINHHAWIGNDKNLLR